MPESSIPEPTFENAMERLEQIVLQMESDKLPLEEMLERYEEGTRLVKFCSEKLAGAEKRIEIITRNATGKSQISEFDPGVTPAVSTNTGSKPTRTASASKSDSGSDDISLF